MAGESRTYILATPSQEVLWSDSDSDWKQRDLLHHEDVGGRITMQQYILEPSSS